MIDPIAPGTLRALAAVENERRRQDSQWGEQNHSPVYWLAIVMEEMGEVGKAVLEGDLAGYRAELIQLAAVAVAAIESYDRNAGYV